MAGFLAACLGAYGQMCALFWKVTHICAQTHTHALFRAAIVFTGLRFHQFHFQMSFCVEPSAVLTYKNATICQLEYCETFFSFLFHTAIQKKMLSLSHRITNDFLVPTLSNRGWSCYLLRYWPKPLQMSSRKFSASRYVAEFALGESAIFSLARPPNQIGFSFFYSTMAVKETVIFTLRHAFLA